MIIHKTPALLQKLYPRLIWSKQKTEKIIYLTFDDGPIPDVTPFVLDTLAQYQAKATFFCVGDNLRKHPTIAREVIKQGHKLGNHTFHHLNGWETETGAYVEDVHHCEEALREFQQGERLFRPPYGKIKRKQIAQLTDACQLIMWSVLSGDYSAKVSPERCLRETIRATRPGAIVLFHDNIKAEKNLTFTLPRYLAHFSAAGYCFHTL